VVSAPLAAAAHLVVIRAVVQHVILQVVVHVIFGLDVLLVQLPVVLLLVGCLRAALPRYVRER
jgi:ABC-type iron transport system FetAB permease component